MKVLKFHVGRGGRFNNPGNIVFIGFEKIEEGSTMIHHFFDPENDKWFEGNGEELDCEIKEDGTGYVNVDGEYDTTICVLENDLNDRQLDALKMAYAGHHGYYWEENKEIESVIERYE